MLFDHCCCDPSCLIFKDDFDRNNNTDIGSDWQEVTGNAEIDANRLRTSILGPGVTIATIVHTSELMVVDVAIAFDSGAITIETAGVIVNYKDVDNYLYVQIEATFSAFAGTVQTRLMFYRRSGGVNTQLGTTKVIDPTNGIANHQLRVCYDGTYLSAMGYREAATKITDGFRAGVFSSSSSAVYFNNFRWYQWRHDCPNCTPNPQCGYCFDSSEPTGTVILDFGAATLTDSGWTNCDQIFGEYVLALISDPQHYICDYISNQGNAGQVGPDAKCYWEYINSAYGTYTDFWCTAIRVHFCFRAKIEANQTGQSKWRVFFTAAFVLPSGAGAICRHGNVAASAQYGGNHTVHGVCNQSPVTLTKEWEFFNAQPSCTGTLPATIELRLG